MITSLQWDPIRDEPYLTLPSHPELRITPFRREDIDDIIEIHNDPVIAKWSYRRPYP